MVKKVCRDKIFNSNTPRSYFPKGYFNTIVISTHTYVKKKNYIYIYRYKMFIAIHVYRNTCLYQCINKIIDVYIYICIYNYDDQRQCTTTIQNM